MYRGEFFYKRFKDNFPYDGTEDQDRLFREIADFVTCDDADILVVNVCWYGKDFGDRGGDQGV